MSPETLSQLQSFDEEMLRNKNKARLFKDGQKIYNLKESTLTKIDIFGMNFCYFKIFCFNKFSPFILNLFTPREMSENDFIVYVSKFNERPHERTAEFKYS